MSSQCNSYVVLGVQLPYDNTEGAYQKYEKFMDSAYEPAKKGVTCIFDGMCGEYIILGRVLAKTDEYGIFSQEPMVFDLAGVQALSEVAQDLHDLFSINQPVKLIVVSHRR